MEEQSIPFDKITTIKVKYGTKYKIWKLWQSAVDPSKYTSFDSFLNDLVNYVESKLKENQ